METIYIARWDGRVFLAIADFPYLTSKESEARQFNNISDVVNAIVEFVTFQSIDTQRTFSSGWAIISGKMALTDKRII